MQKNKTAMAVADPDWQTKRSTVASRMEYIFNNELLSDVKFIVPVSNGSEVKKVIPAHKFVLAVSSPVFFTMFYGQMAETTDSIELPDCDYESLMEFFRFLYSDDAHVRRDVVIPLMYLAKKYMVPALVQMCSTYLQQHFLKASNVFFLLPIAQRFDDKDLKEQCWKVIEKRTEEALESDDFCALERSVVESVVKRDRLCVTEVELFKAVDRWATRQSERRSGKNKREIVGDAIVKAMRFPQMSQKEFVSVVADRDILTTQEIVHMMKHYNDIALTSPLPFPQAPRIAIRYEICRRFKGYLPPKKSSEKRGCVNYHLDLKVSKVIHLYGLQHFGSENGKYTVSVEVHNPVHHCLAKREGTFVAKKDEVHEYYGFLVLFDSPVRLEGGIYYPIESKISGPNPWLGIKEDPAFEFSGLIFDCSVRDGESAGQHPGFLYDQDVNNSPDGTGTLFNAY